MRRYNYFDDDEIGEGSRLSANEPLEAPKPPLSGQQAQYVPAPKPEISDLPTAPAVSSSAGEIQQEDVLEAIKAFSHKSGEKLVSVAKTVNKTVREHKPTDALEKLAGAGRGKRVLAVFIMLIVVVLVFTGMVGIFMHSINKGNRRVADFNSKAGAVCTDYINKYGVANYENLYNNYGVEGYRLTGLCFARELDFDNDGNSELLLSYNKNGEFFNEVWGDNAEGEFTALFSERAAQTANKADDAWTVLYHKNNRYMIGVHSEQSFNDVTFYQLRGNAFEEKMTCTYDKRAEAYVIDNQVDADSFERIKYAVLGGQRAAVSVETASSIIERFTGALEQTTDKKNKKEEEKKNRKSAYYDIVQEYNKRYGSAKVITKDGIAYVEGLAGVELLDFNGDGKDELAVIYRKSIKVRDNDIQGDFVMKAEDRYFLEVYRYAGKKAIMCYANEGISNSLSDSKDIYYLFGHRDKKILYIQNSFRTANYGREIYANNSLLEFNGTEFKAQQRAAWVTRYGYTRYLVDAQTVTQNSFNASCEGIPIFMTEDYDTSVYHLVYVQRSSVRKAELEQLVEQTQTNIRKLDPKYVAD